MRRSWQEKCKQSSRAFHGLLKHDPVAEAEAAAARIAAKQARSKVRRVLTKRMAEITSAFHSGEGPAPPDNASTVPGRPPTREYQRIARGRGRQTGFSDANRDGTLFNPNLSAVAAPPQAANLAPVVEPEPEPEQHSASPQRNELVPVSLSQSLANDLCDTRQLPLVAGKTFGALQLGPALDLALATSARAAVARQNANATRCAGDDASDSAGGFGSGAGSEFGSEQELEEQVSALSEALLSLMGRSPQQQQGPAATGGWNQPQIESFGPGRQSDNQRVPEDRWQAVGRAPSPEAQPDLSVAAPLASTLSLALARTAAAAAAPASAAAPSTSKLETSTLAVEYEDELDFLMSQEGDLMTQNIARRRRPRKQKWAPPNSLIAARLQHRDNHEKKPVSLRNTTPV